MKLAIYVLIIVISNRAALACEKMYTYRHEPMTTGTAERIHV